MRTTVTLYDDVAAAVERLRRDRSMGLSEAINTLVREGLRAPKARRSFKQRTARVGLKIDVTNVADAIDAAEGPAWR